MVVIESISNDYWASTFIVYGFTILRFIAMATVRILLGIIWYTLIIWCNVFHRYLLKEHSQPSGEITNQYCRDRLVKLAQAEIGVREKTNANDGERVEAYLKTAGLKKGFPYCAAFVSFIYAKEGFAKPRTAWCPDLFPKSRITGQYLAGNVLGIYFPELKRIAHVGIIENLRGDWCSSIEANTNPGGGRNGDGVYRRIRHRRTIHQVADWINKERSVP
ncbi:peptidoglycan-binding protein [Pedobacter sp. MC2016-15]|uniref:peptidoglycan-binding protein n=1 Tax=Pedobacter sp. MC2016-15 TaxID=2994473 RepID=UPI002247519E|nr:peptidoglycan-binding protein [Pedobacter sp. MC2016-15]MCX2477758.1 peptidoglycan-binding protein [Pedobacter sp. MC2016-15]